MSVPESNHELHEAPVGVIPSEEGIQESWMPDRGRHDNARTSTDFSQSHCHRHEQVGSRYALINFGLIPTEFFSIDIGMDASFSGAVDKRYIMP